MRATARACDSFGKRVAWSFSESRVSDHVVDLIGILTETLIKVEERPSGVSLGVHGLGYLPDVSHDLRVAPKVVDELCVGGSEETFAYGAEPRPPWRSRLLDPPIPPPHPIPLPSPE